MTTESHLPAYSRFTHQWQNKPLIAIGDVCLRLPRAVPSRSKRDELAGQSAVLTKTVLAQVVTVIVAHRRLVLSSVDKVAREPAEVVGQVTDQPEQLGIRPAATYRVQFGPGFTFDDAARAADYLAKLGVSHLYCSPFLQAAGAGSAGYDVVDHS